MALQAHILKYCVDGKGNQVSPSHYQEAIFREAIKYNLLVQAVAGSGKSWTLRVLYRIMEEECGQCVIVAFNYHIANEMKLAGLNAKTMNGLGYAAIMWKGKEVFGCTPAMDTEDEKIDTHIYATIPKDRLRTVGPGVKQLVQLARGMAAGTQKCVNMKLRPMQVTSRGYWNALIDQFNIDFNDDTQWDEPEGMDDEPPVAPKGVLEYCEQILHRCNTQTSIVDFQDQKCFPILYNLPMRRYASMLVDETQDLNSLDLELISRSLRPGGRFTAVGDRAQSIYSWRGADTESMDRIKVKFRCKELPLSICYRCPTSHLDMAREIVPQIEARPGAPVGVVERFKRYNASHFPDKCTVICRMNAPLIKLAFRLMRKRRPVRVLGRDMSKGLINVLIKIEEGYKARQHLAETGTQMEYLIAGLMHWRDTRVAKAEAARKPKKVEAIMDQFSTLMLFTEECDGSTIRDVIDEIKKVLGTENNKGGITLSSIHRMKGGEDDVVFILDDFLMPMKSATTEREIQEEMHLKYVSRTRSRDMLFFIDSDGWQEDAA